MSRSFVKTIIRKSGKGWTWHVMDRLSNSSLGSGDEPTWKKAFQKSKLFRAGSYKETSATRFKPRRTKMKINC